MPDAYDHAYRISVEDPERFWLDAANALHWDRPPSEAHDGNAWFPDGSLNTCFNAVDRHVEQGRGEQVALVYDSPVTGMVQRWTFAELKDAVAQTAGMIAAQGVGKGDRVIIYMPMVPEAVFAMLACARIGAIHSVVFGGFSATELAKRIDDATPKLVLAASCGIEPGRVVAYKPLLDEAMRLAYHKVENCIILQRPMQEAEMQAGRDHDWDAAFSFAPKVDPVSVAATDPLYILYTSGTTGIPKGVVRDNGGHAVALCWSMQHIYGLNRGETFWAASDIGWVVGHSYIVYGPLLHGCTTILYEGKPVGTPDAGAFWRVIRDHGVDVFFTAPTAIRAIRREDPDGAFIARDGLGQLRTLFLAGERADPDTVHWAEQHLKMPVVDHWWQTELGWPAIATCVGLGRSETLAGSAGHPVPGYRFHILDEDHQKQPRETIGEIVIELPLPPGCFPTLWNNETGYQESYLTHHPGYYTAGDAGMIDADGRVHVMSRIDDIINVAGHRLSTGGMEQVIGSHPAVAECAVISIPDDLKGELPFALVVTKAGTMLSEEDLARELAAKVRAEIGPVAAFRHSAIVDKLPKTRSGKILRGTLRKIASGEDFVMPATIEDPVALDLARVAISRTVAVV